MLFDCGCSVIAWCGLVDCVNSVGVSIYSLMLVVINCVALVVLCWFVCICV